MRWLTFFSWVYYDHCFDFRHFHKVALWHKSTRPCPREFCERLLLRFPYQNIVSLQTLVSVEIICSILLCSNYRDQFDVMTATWKCPSDPLQFAHHFYRDKTVSGFLLFIGLALKYNNIMFEKLWNLYILITYANLASVRNIYRLLFEQSQSSCG